jgi:N-acetylglutamate synthase-like GNAT family acetyltransferase
MIRRCTSNDFHRIYEIINDSAQAYKGVIPPDCWHEPYMSKEELRQEIRNGVKFSCYTGKHNEIIGVMGIQDKGTVTLVRHAYVDPNNQNQGIGSALLKKLMRKAKSPVLTGTWLKADWAIKFYEKNGFKRINIEESKRLLERYWKISKRQVETSVVLKHIPII